MQRRFDVFLDRFAVEPGVDFQRRLDEDLGDKAFVLLLESPELRQSRWVRHEILYAHSRRIEILALTLPGTASSELVPTIDDAFRLRLDPSDLSDDGTLSLDGLALVLDKIEPWACACTSSASGADSRKRHREVAGCWVYLQPG